jgi:hypothetical protein
MGHISIRFQHITFEKVGDGEQEGGKEQQEVSEEVSGDEEGDDKANDDGGNNDGGIEMDLILLLLLEETELPRCLSVSFKYFINKDLYGGVKS